MSCFNIMVVFSFMHPSLQNSHCGWVLTMHEVGAYLGYTKVYTVYIVDAQHMHSFSVVILLLPCIHDSFRAHVRNSC